MARPTLPASDTAAHAAWIAAAVEAPFHGPIRLPRLTGRKAEPAEPLPDLFDDPEPPPAARHITDIVRELYRGALSTPTPAAARRKARRREREAAASA